MKSPILILLLGATAFYFLTRNKNTTPANAKGKAATSDGNEFVDAFNKEYTDAQNAETTKATRGRG